MSKDMGGCGMTSGEVVAAYRLNAANCVEMAKQFPDLDHKLALFDMAQAWVRLADITEKFGDALLVTAQQNRPIV
jgi:hypothetical protein